MQCCRIRRQGSHVLRLVQQLQSRPMKSMCPLLAAKALMKDNPQHASLFENEPILYSFDSARGIHTSSLIINKTTGKSLLSEDGLTPELRVLLPAYAPDMHRVIEYTHGTAEMLFKKWMYNNPGKHTMEQYKSAFEALYKKCTTAAIISADVAGLPELYSWVHKNGGNWAPSRMR